MAGVKKVARESVKTVGTNYHNTDGTKIKGVTSETMKKFGRNVARLKNQRGK